MKVANQTKPFWKRRIHPALALWLIAPIIGELFSGSSPLNEYLSPITILTLGMLYGSGAILVRELIILWRKGWLSLLLLGMAYGIYEEGLVVRSFFDPNWMDLGKLGVYGRAVGVNWVWVEHLTIFHTLLSIAASIILVEVLFPERRSESWIGTRGLVWNIIAFTAMLPLGGLLNTYDAPDVWLGICWLAITLLTLAVWRMPATMKLGSSANVPRPRWFFWTGFIASFIHHFIIYFTAEKNSPHFLISMFLVAVFDLFILWLILRWNSQGKRWDDRHRLALFYGPICFFLIIGPLTTNGQYPIMYYSNPVFLILLWWIYRKINQRVNREIEMSPKTTSV